MALLTANGYYCWRITSIRKLSGNPFRLYGSTDNLVFQLNHEGYGAKVVAFASRKSSKKLTRNKERGNEVIIQSIKSLDDNNGVEGEELPFMDRKSETSSVRNIVSSRRDVLQACTLTSGLIAALGLGIRQVSPVVSAARLPFFDCSVVSFGFEAWHLEVITGLVLLISVSRYTLLQTWPDFAESSESANTQVLTSLQPFDYLIVAFLPGISEELLFRGGLLPVFGANIRSALAVAALFGVLHLGSGRKFSFAIWATFVGAAYGYATITTSSIIVPMAAHALNNLIGALLWYQTSKSPRQISS